MNRAASYHLPPLPANYLWSVRPHYESGVYSRGSSLKLEIKKIHNIAGIHYNSPVKEIVPQILTLNERVVQTAAQVMLQELLTLLINKK
jgi:hypothetical protein